MLVILDNGHGVNTPGKLSPDGRLKEYKYTREIVYGIHETLKREDIDSYILVPEDTDIPLKERVDRANKLYLDKDKKAILISVHCNAAASDNLWHTATGWSVFVSQNASNNSKLLANCLAELALKNKLKVRKLLPNLNYWVLSLAICRDTKCPSILTENLFLDNKTDVDFLLSEEGRLTIIDIHVNGIKLYLNQIS